jgi:hypothetical protein
VTPKQLGQLVSPANLVTEPLQVFERPILRRGDGVAFLTEGSCRIARRAAEPLIEKTFLPAPYAGLGLASLPHNRGGAEAARRHSHNLSPPDVLLRLQEIPIDSERRVCARVRMKNLLRRAGVTLTAHTVD